MNRLLAEIHLDESPIPSGIIFPPDKAAFERKARVWRIYEAEAEPPPNPHARNVNFGFVIDLSNGALYMRTQPLGRKISGEHLTHIRELAEAQGIVIPPLTS